MVRTSSTSKRFGFTMIELIFAIVIIAISVMSLPMMTQVTNKGLEESLVQEAIFWRSFPQVRRRASWQTPISGHLYWMR